MSVDMIMYEVQKLDEDDRALLKGTVVDEVECPDEDWCYKFYPKSDVDRNPERYSEIIKCARTIELRKIVTDSKQCYIDHGLPVDAQNWSSSYTHWGITVRWDGKSISIPREALQRYSREKTEIFYGVKRKYIDADISSYMCRDLMEQMQKAYGIDLSYHPHRLTKETAQLIWKYLLTVYDAGDLYPTEDRISLMCEITKCMLDEDERKVFLEFQD